MYSLSRNSIVIITEMNDYFKVYISLILGMPKIDRMEEL